MRSALVREFRRRFGCAPEVAARAPGRVNLIGEHTDYNEGLVLPCAIDRETLVLAARRGDPRVRVYSRERAEEREFDSCASEPGGDWLDYVQGVVAALRERGIDTGGFDIAIASEVPPESGLSSSAALELALVTALDRLLDLALDATARCHLAHRAETAFVGVPCGIMDQFASGLARRDCALRIDCRSLQVAAVPWPGPRLRLLIADSGVRRALAAGAYGERRRECLEAFETARRAGAAPPGATALRDLGPERLASLERVLPPRLFRRTRHVVLENQRVDATCAALLAGDLAAAGAALREGMRSLREDFEVSTPELDALCELADAVPGVYGSRLTGAGFGGCTIHLVDPAASQEVSEIVASGFERRFGRRPPLLVASPADGASVVE
jgi:galactokinase